MASRSLRKSYRLNLFVLLSNLSIGSMERCHFRERIREFVGHIAFLAFSSTNYPAVFSYGNVSNFFFLWFILGSINHL